MQETKCYWRDAVLSDLITVPSHITHMENNIDMLMVLINLGHD